jgi:hypothetical protein
MLCVSSDGRFVLAEDAARHTHQAHRQRRTVANIDAMIHREYREPSFSGEMVFVNV